MVDLKWYEEPLEPMDYDRAHEVIRKVQKEPTKQVIGQEPVI